MHKKGQAKLASINADKQNSHQNFRKLKAKHSISMKRNGLLAENRMKKKTSLPSGTTDFLPSMVPVILAALFMLSACAPMSSNQLAVPQSTSFDNYDQNAVSSEDTDFIALLEEDIADEQCVSVESEQFLKEELAALEKTGPWQSAEEEAPEKKKDKTKPFPLTINKQVKFYIKEFQTTQKRYFARSLVRSGKYLPMIRRELKAAGLPQELAYLAFVESGFMPNAYSRAGAMGLWQFMKPTGKKFGLRIDSWVDERRNPEKATRAAVRYLSDLYERFGSWHLAVAGYNAGEGKIANAVSKFKTRNFWKLANHRYLKLETKRYVPKLIAAIIIAKDLKKYGFNDIRPAAPLRYDEYAVPPGVPLSSVATLCKTDVRKLRELNPELRTNHVPTNQGSYLLRLPKGTRALVAANRSLLQPKTTIGFKTHIVKKGENLTRICKLYNLDKISLLKANNLRTGKMRPGQRLRIPYNRPTASALTDPGFLLTSKAKKRYTQTGTSTVLTFFSHTVKPGETLSQIARRFHVTTRDLMAWNNLKNAGRIRVGQRLILYGDRIKHKGRAVAAKTPSQVTTLHAAVNKRRHTPAKQKRTRRTKRQTYKVVAGDSLWSIAQGLGVSTHDLKTWNHLTTNTLRPGMELIVSAASTSAKTRSPRKSQKYYRVRNGDSIWTIARRFQVSTRDLRAWNNLKSNVIRPGIRLIIRGV